MDIENIQKNVEILIQEGGQLEVLNWLILELYKHNEKDALSELMKLAASDYGGITYKSEYQIVSSLAALHWGVLGINALEGMVINIEGFRPINNTTRILAHISSRTLGNLLFMATHLECVKRLELDSDKYKSETWVTAAKDALINVVKSVERDDTFPIGLMNNLSSEFNPKVQEHLFAALVIRWFNISSNGIEEFNQLIKKTPIEEIECQNFLKTNPYILEPFHAQIWSKPRLGEELIPDFIVRSIDNSYTVIEIEKPDISIMTKAGELSAKATHAKRQALDFRDWLINNNLYAIKKFPSVYRPYCLVVIGMESQLSDIQKLRLRQENESTQGVLRIVGFDWIYDRAKSTFDNLINFGFDRDKITDIIV